MSQGSTLYVIAYDISDDRRRGRLHKLLSAYGQWTQFSLFECFLTPLQRVDLMARLHALLDPDSDRVRFYALCDACLKRVETVGGSAPAEPTLFVL